ncbi:phosphopantetheine-binding protein [Oricola cellulosilytica]|uniref:Acyl carrier protein n=1 Tax=Oricola cellulosilytica TaxID=1429082 RepID=A0A4R0PI90_9HYPH|nr:phosphopantetheine-binding protein [Oricola cellulosilytica]TCD16250.1 acyl carrier protein [Oricola cellulosilytica]
MTSMNIQSVRETIADLLAERGQGTEFRDDESLFDSGRLDSIAAVNVLLALETEFGVDLSDPDFDVSRIDSLDEIKALLGATTS